MKAMGRLLKNLLSLGLYLSLISILHALFGWGFAEYGKIVFWFMVGSLSISAVVNLVIAICTLGGLT